MSKGLCSIYYNYSKKERGGGRTTASIFDYFNFLSAKYKIPSDRKTSKNMNYKVTQEEQSIYILLK